MLYELSINQTVFRFVRARVVVAAYSEIGRSYHAFLATKYLIRGKNVLWLSLQPSVQREWVSFARCVLIHRKGGWSWRTGSIIRWRWCNSVPELMMSGQTVRCHLKLCTVDGIEGAARDTAPVPEIQALKPRFTFNWRSKARCASQEPRPSVLDISMHPTSPLLPLSPSRTAPS